jgi:DNA-binding protein HU-beta
MIKADIINQVAEEAAITKVKAIEAVEAVFEAMKAAMMRGERIELRGFGVFQVKPRKKGIGRNPRTGREVRIPPREDHPLQAGEEPPEPRELRARVPSGPSGRSSIRSS